MDSGAVQHGVDAMPGSGHRRAGPPTVGDRVVDVDPVVDVVRRGAGPVEGLAAHDPELAVGEDGGAHAAPRLGEGRESGSGVEARRPAVGGGVVDLHGVESVGNDVAVPAAGPTPAEDEIFAPSDSAAA